MRVMFLSVLVVGGVAFARGKARRSRVLLAESSVVVIESVFGMAMGMAAVASFAGSPQFPTTATDGATASRLGHATRPVSSAGSQAKRPPAAARARSRGGLSPKAFDPLVAGRGGTPRGSSARASRQGFASPCGDLVGTGGAAALAQNGAVSLGGRFE